MRIRALAAVLLVALGLSSCAARKLPSTLAETHTSYSYIPLDPLPVVISPASGCYSGGRASEDAKPTGKYKALLDSLPDQAVRIATGQYDASGTLVYGPAKIGVSGHSYQVVLDYVSVDTTNASLYIERVLVDSPDKDVSVFDDSIKEKTRDQVFRDPEREAFAFLPKSTQKPKGDRVVVPVYVAAGLRLTASVTVTKATTNPSRLG